MLKDDANFTWDKIQIGDTIRIGEEVITLDSPELYYKYKQGYVEGVSELFESNPELSKIGTPEQYSKYLKNIFPNSAVQSIVYHGGSPEKDFSKPELGASGFHGYFAASKNVANEFAERWTRNKTSKGETKAILLNIQNPLITDKLYQGEYEQSVEKVKSTIKEGKYDGIIAKDTKDKFSDKLGAYDQYIAFKENQIHILGSEQDLTGFSEFILNGAINTNNKVTKVYNVPRDLKPSLHIFTVNGVQQNTFDLLPVRLSFAAEGVIEKSELDKNIIDQFTTFIQTIGGTKDQLRRYLSK